MGRYRYFKKGEEFEDFVLNECFPDELFTIVEITPESSHRLNRRVESRLRPDFCFRDKKSGDTFWVEAKFRSRMYRDKVIWAESWQMERYKEFEKEKGQPVFLVLGLGGVSWDPMRIYAIPLKEIKYTGLYKSFLRDYEIKMTPIKYHGGVLL